MLWLSFYFPKSITVGLRGTEPRMQWHCPFKILIKEICFDLAFAFLNPTKQKVTAGTW